MPYRWFLSYHTPDEPLAARLKAAIERKDAAAQVFFAPTNLRAGEPGRLSSPRKSARNRLRSARSAKRASANGRYPNMTRRSTSRSNQIGHFRSSSSCLKGRSRLAWRFCASCTGLLRPILRPRRTSRARSRSAQAQAELWRYTFPPIAAWRRWRRRTAIISSAARSRLLKFRSPWPLHQTDCRFHWQFGCG